LITVVLVAGVALTWLVFALAPAVFTAATT
jgi:hypothetical protein